MSAPIPLRLLVDTATVTEPDTSAFADYDGEWREPYRIANVRLDSATSRRDGTWHDDAPQSGATLFVDAHGSVPPRRPAVGSRVAVSRGGSEVYEGVVQSVQACLDESGIHHWEVALS